MDQRISVVINTLNEEKNIVRVLNKVLWADEVLVCDMYSDDKTAEVAKKLGAKIIHHKRTNYVEPARNFAVSKASGDWILVLDADEEIPNTLASKLQQMVKKPISSDFILISRKNIIFGKWIKHSGWWPDYQVRFFRKGSVEWSDQIHRSPQTRGVGLKLPQKEQFAIVHHNYQSMAQFIERVNRYTSIEAQQLIKEGYYFDWRDLLRKPLNEFLSRFFANRGYQDGMHGLALSLLQALSFLIVYLKVWEMEKFKDQEITLKEFKQLGYESASQIDYWFKHNNLSDSPFKKFIHKIKNKYA